MKVSWIVLTHNRKQAVFKSVHHNWFVSAYPVHELIHVDNATTDEDFCDTFASMFRPQVQIRHQSNLGVSKGYNRGYLNATGSHVLITGMDRLMPAGWLRDIALYFGKIPNTGVISIYAPPVRLGDNYRVSRYFERLPIHVNDFWIQPAVPFEARICSKEFFHKVGFLREDFDTYGFEDCEWGMRAERVARELGLINYVIPGLMANHLEEDKDFLMADGTTHRAYKDSFLEKNKIKYDEMAEQGFPYYNPYF